MILTSAVETALFAETRVDALRRDPDLESYRGADWRSYARSRVDRGVAVAPRVAAAKPRPVAPRPTAARELSDAEASAIMRHTGVDPRPDSAQSQMLDAAFGLIERGTNAASYDAKSAVQTFGGAMKPQAKPKREADRSAPEVAARLDAAMGLADTTPSSTVEDRGNLQVFGAKKASH